MLHGADSTWHASTAPGVAVRGMRVTYDREHHRIGFAPHNCPLRPSPPPPAAAASSAPHAHTPQATPQSPPHAHTPSSAASAPPRLASAEASAVPDLDLGFGSRSNDGSVSNSSENGAGEVSDGGRSSRGGEDAEEGGERDERVEGDAGVGEDEEKREEVGGGQERAASNQGDESNGAAEGAWADEEEEQWWDGVSGSVLLGGDAGGGEQGRGELASWRVREGVEGSGRVEEEVQQEGEREEEGEEEGEEGEGGEGRGGGGSSDGSVGVGEVPLAPLHPLSPARHWSSCTHTPVSIVKEASRKYTTIRWRCKGRGGQRVLADAEEALAGAVTPADEREADGGRAHETAEGKGRAGADGDGAEAGGVAASVSAGVDGGEQGGAVQWGSGSHGQHTHTHLLLHLVFSARHPPLLPPPPPVASASRASAPPLSLPSATSTAPPLPAVLPALLPAVAAALLVRPSRVSLAAFSSSTLLLPSPPRTVGDGAHDAEQQQRHFTMASLTIQCPSPRAHHTVPARTCSHEAQRLAALVRAGRCQGVGERVQRAMRGEGAVEKVGSADSPVLLRCSLHALLPAAHRDTAPDLSDSRLATPSHAAASAAAQPDAASVANGSSKDEGQIGGLRKGEADEGEGVEHGVVEEVVSSVLGGTAMLGRQQQGVQEGSDVPLG
ncbi:unnamed protein product [Closterium sp. Naga37s-1]|nr:unnamed protein product [Closterium sp. Naga37s-1]